MIERVINDLYTSILAQRRRGNTKAGIPENCNEELEQQLTRFFNTHKRRNVKWENVLLIYYNYNEWGSNE